jgi:hypothetical protein
MRLVLKERPLHMRPVPILRAQLLVDSPSAQKTTRTYYGIKTHLYGKICLWVFPFHPSLRFHSIQDS